MGNQFLRRFLANKSRSSAERQQREIRKGWFHIGWQNDFREGNRNSEGACSLKDFKRQRNPDPSFLGAAAKEGEENQFDIHLSRDGR